MKRLITACLVTGLFVCAVPATNAQPVAVHRLSHGCQKTFTVPMAMRAARKAYSGTRTVTRTDLNHLRYFWSCQKNTHAQSFVAWYYSHRHHLWWDRFHPAVEEPESGLAACIIQRESGGNPQAVNGQYEGIAQWSPTSWSGGGGRRFASTPLGATYNQQVIVLNDMLPAQAGQWTPYDGC